MPTLLRGPEGQTQNVEDDAQAADLMARGFVPYTQEHLESDVQAIANEPEDRGVLGTVNAAASAGLSGLTLGASDVLLSSVLTDNERRRLLSDRRANPTVSTVSEVVGNVAPALLSGGAATPAGALSRVGQKIAASGAERGLAAHVGALAASGAVEGAAQVGGSYLAQTALENKPLSAEAFVGEMGKGALFGGAAAGALGVSERALRRARSLFPKSEISRSSAQAVEREATDALRGALDDGAAMQSAAARELEGLKLQTAQERLAAGAVPTSTAVDEIAPGRVNWAIERADQQAAKAAAKGRPRRAFGGDGTQVGSAPGPSFTPPPEAPLAPAAAPSPARGGTAQRAVFDLAPPGPPPPRTVPWQEIGAPAPAAAEATTAGKRLSQADEILNGAPPAPLDIDAQLRKIARGGGVDLAPALEQPTPKWMASGTPGGSLEDDLRAMAAQADAGVPLREMRAPAAEPPAPTPPARPSFDAIDAVRVGSPGDGVFEMRVQRPGAAAPEVVTVKRQDVEAAVKSRLPEGFGIGPLQVHRDFKIGAGIPAVEDIAENALYVVRPSEFVDYGVMGNELKAANRDSILEAWSKGERLRPLDVDVTPDGHLYIEDGNHRLQAAARSDREVVVRFRKTGPSWKPQSHAQDITDRVAAELPAEAPGVGATAADDAVAALAPPRGLAEVANEAVAAANPQAARILDAARKEATARAEVEALFSAPSGPGSRTVSGRRGAAAGIEPPAPKTGTIPWQQLEEMKLRGEAPVPVAPERPVPSHADVAAEVRRAVGRARPAGSAWVPLTTPGGDVLGAAPILDDVAEAALVGPATVASRKGGRAAVAPAVADEILSGSRAAAAGGDVNEQIAAAIGKRVGHMVPMGADLADAAKKIGAHEEALAELADALGPAAPAAATERAAKLRAAQASAADAHGAATAQTAQALEDHAIPDALRKTGGAAKGSFGALADVGAGLEVLKLMGVAVPDIERIPVIGPVLGMYLKARAALGIWKRAGGAIPQSMEGLIAAKGAAHRDRATAAVGKMLAIGEKAVRKAQPAAAAMGGLGYRLFPGTDGEEKPKAGAKVDPVAQYHRRMDELARAAQPGAIASAVQRRIPTSDPALLQHLIETVHRKLAFIDSKAPRPPAIPALLRGDGEWRPSKEQLATWSRYLAAAEDPAGVLEHVAAGHGVSVEAAETLRTVYPELFGAARQTLLQHAAVMENTIPYRRRVSLSILFDVPTDRTTTADHVRFLQQGSAAGAPAGPAAQPGQGSPAGAAPPTPSIAGPVGLGDRTMTRLDRRAGM